MSAATSSVEGMLHLVERLPGGGWRYTENAYRTRKLAKIKSRCMIDANDCWLWQGFIQWNGYGQTNFRGRTCSTHRAAYLASGRDIPAGHDVCHKCDIRRCCNPEHLFTGPRVANHADMWAKGRAWQQKETCNRGHLWSEHSYTVIGTNKSTGKSGIWRKCKLCDRINHRLNAGWTLEEAISLPVTPPGKRPVASRRAAR